MSQINGIKIREIRRKLGFSSADKFAKHVGISKSHVYNIEKGITNVSLETLQKVADGLNVQLRDIFIDDDLRDVRHQIAATVVESNPKPYYTEFKNIQPRLEIMESLSRMVREFRDDTSSYVLSNIRSGLMDRMQDKVDKFLKDAEKEDGKFLSGLFVTSDTFTVKEIPSEILPEILALLFAYEEDVKQK